MADLVRQVDVLRTRGATGPPVPPAKHDEKRTSLEIQAVASEARLRAPEAGHQGGREDIQADLRRSVAEPIDEEAPEGAAVHKLLGHGRPEEEGLRLAYMRRPIFDRET